MGAACHRQPKPVEGLRGSQDFSTYSFTHIRGHRDGDVLLAQAGFSDGKYAFLVDLRFGIDTTARLTAGRWQWMGGGRLLGAGTVEAKSVMFFGGQNDSPSIGGTYVLVDRDGPVFQVTIPVSLLADRRPTLPQRGR